MVELKDQGPAELAEAVIAAVESEWPAPKHAAAVRRAVDLAVRVHADQRRANLTVTSGGQLLPGSGAYVVHPLRNGLRICRWGETDPDIVIAALLHDTVEDQPDKLAPAAAGADAATLRRAALGVLAAEFGARTAGIVDAVTNPLPQPGETRDQRLARYVDHVAEAVADYGAFMVKVADFVDNALGLHHQTGNPRMTVRLARKYLPLCPILLAAAARHEAAWYRLHPDLWDKLNGAETYLTEMLVAA